MNENITELFEPIELTINTKYKNRFKESLKERAMLSLEYFVMFVVFIVLTIFAANYQRHIIGGKVVQNIVIFLLCLIDVATLLLAIFHPFFIIHNRGLKGRINFTIYKNDKNEFRCRCSGQKRSKSVSFDEPIEIIKIEKYSIRIYYTAFKYFKIPLTQVEESKVNALKNIKF